MRYPRLEVALLEYINQIAIREKEEKALDLSVLRGRRSSTVRKVVPGTARAPLEAFFSKSHRDAASVLVSFFPLSRSLTLIPLLLYVPVGGVARDYSATDSSLARL